MVGADDQDCAVYHGGVHVGLGCGGASIDEQGLHGVGQDVGDHGREEISMVDLAVLGVVLALMNRSSRGLVMMLFVQGMMR